MYLIQQILNHSTKKYPDKEALLYQNESYTYHQVQSVSYNLSAEFTNMGLKRGDRVCIFLKNSPQTVFSIFAVLYADAVFSVINHEIKWKKLNAILENLAPKILVISKTYHADTIELIKDRFPEINIFFSESIKTDVASIYTERRAANIDLDLAAIIYTSGSSGPPKGVTMTHRNMFSALRSISDYLNNTKNDSILSALPLAFDYGLYQVFLAFYSGAALILFDNFLFLHPILQSVKKKNVTALPLVPVMLSMILKLKNVKKYELNRLRYISNTGSALSKDDIFRFHQLFPDVDIFSMYGLTECKRVSYLPPDLILKKPQSVGKPMPNLEVFIFDRNNNSLPPNKTGQLVIRSSTVMQGYWKNITETDKKLKNISPFKEKLLFSGDLFRMDVEGFLYFEGRMDDMLKINGEQVSPKEIEDVLNELEGIKESAIIGIKTSKTDIELTAFIAAQKEIDEKDILRHCRNNLESVAIPKKIIFVKNLPRTNSGKINKSALYKKAANRQ